MAVLWIDCEFNEHEHRDQLISMALVAETGQEWYEAIPCPNPGAWVAEHVLPIIGKELLRDRLAMSLSLRDFLARWTDVIIVADWPTDIALLCDLLITGPGQRIDTPEMRFELIRLDGASAQPHNALADARGLRDEHLRWLAREA